MEGGHVGHGDKVYSWQRNQQKQRRGHWMNTLGLASVCSLSPAFFHYDFAYKKSVFVGQISFLPSPTSQFKRRVIKSLQ